MKINIIFLSLLVITSEAGSAPVEVAAKFDRSLQGADDVDTIAIGDDSATVAVTVDQTAANGLVTYGGKGLVLTPLVCNPQRKVTCTATLNTGLGTTADMRFALRKALQPDVDENGEPKDFDCEANGDQDFVSPDLETCEVTNFLACPIGDLIYGYVAILDNGLNLGATYTINFSCETIDPPCSCFSQDVTVDVLGKGTTLMKELEIGDKILTSTNKYEPIYAFAHLDKARSAEYLQINTNGQKAPLEVTKDHLLLINDKYLPAENAKVGDLLSNDDNGSSVVSKISTAKKIGMYAPLTPSGTMVVNGVKASSYVSLPISKDTTVLGGTVVIGESIDTNLSFHFINHIALSLIRMACMGVSSRFCNTDQISEETGYPPFVSFWFQLVQMFQRQSFMVQALLLVAFFCIVGPFYAMESIFFGPVLAPTIVLGLVVAIVVAMKQKKQSNNAKSKQI